MPQRLGEGADDVLEAPGGRVDGVLELGQLVVVLDQPHFGQVRGQLGVGLQSAPTRPEVVDVGGVQTVQGTGLLEIGTAAHPELAEPPVAVELLARRPRRAGPQVEDRLAGGLDHQHVAGLLRAGQIGVGAVRPEPVVGVVAADLEIAGRDHQPLTGNRCASRALLFRVYAATGSWGRSS